MSRELTLSDYCRAARKLKCSVAAIKAVAEVETRGKAFYPDGFPVILFERHKFHKFTNGRFDGSHPSISNPEAGGYGKAGQHQRDRFNEAFALDQEAAMKSCSWGKFQIMGFNFHECGFPNVGAFVDAMKESEGKQLDAFVGFVITNHLDRHLRTLNFAAFAEGYNGGNYRINKYDTKMRTAYNKYIKEEVDCDDVSSDAPAKLITTAPNVATPEGATSVTQTQVTQTEGEATSQTVEVKNEQDVNVSAEVNTPPPYNGIGFMPTIKRDMAGVFGGNLSIQGLVAFLQSLNGLPEWVNKFLVWISILALVAGAFYLVFRLVHFGMFKWEQKHKTQMEVEAKTSVTKKDIKWI